MAEINNDEKRIGVSGEQIEEVVVKMPAVEADVKENKQSISALQTASAQHTADIAKNTADIELKANADNVYSREETDNAITAKVAEIVAGAPEEFDTLKEMSDWLTEHSDSAATMNTAIQANTKAIADNATAIEGNTADIEQNKSDILSAKNDIAVNRTTLGTQCKNLLNITAATRTDATSTLSITVNDDNSITFNGTAAASLFIVIGKFMPTKIGKYVLTGCPTGGSNTTYQLYIKDKAYSTGNPNIFNMSTIAKTDVSIVIYKDTVCDNLTFYPMIREADITDNTYEPYTPSVNERLTANENDILSAQNQIDTQTLITTSGEANSKNWYRAFEVSQKGAVRTGIILINRGYSNGLPEQYILSINIGYYANKINLISRFIEKDSNNVGRAYIDKIRIVRATSSPSKNNCYIDIHYNADLLNVIYASILANTTNSEAFFPVDFTVAEIPEGYTSYEFDLTGKDIFERLTALETSLAQTE